MNAQRVLVTGGAGFIGGALVDSFHDETDLRALDVAPAPDLPEGVDVIGSDVRDSRMVEQAVEGVDVVFHEAALVGVEDSITDPVESHSVNAIGTLNVLEAARRHDARVVLASSAAVYGDPARVPIAEDDPLDPTSPYGLDKLTVDHYARLYHELYGLETVTLRYFNAYGPGQSGGDYAGVIEVFLDQARADDPIPVHGDGEQTRDFVHIDDIVRANRLAAETDAVGESFNIGTGESVRINDLAALVIDLLDSDSSTVYQAERPGDIRHSRADISRARRKLAYEPSVDLREGLETLVAGRQHSLGGRQ